MEIRLEAREGGGGTQPRETTSGVPERRDINEADSQRGVQRGASSVREMQEIRKPHPFFRHSARWALERRRAEALHGEQHWWCPSG